MDPVTSIKIKDLPSPKGHFIWGHLPQFNTYNKHQVLERWVEECGDLFKINFVGKEFVVSSRSSLNSTILRLRPEKFRRFSKIDEILKEMGVSGVFNAEVGDWKRHRKPIAEALNMQHVKGYYPVVLDKTFRLLKKFKTFSEANKTIDVQKEFMLFTVDITTEIAFGHKLDTINNMDDSFQKHLEVIFPMINERITAPIPIWRFFKRKKDKVLLESIEAIKAVIYQFIEESKSRIKNNPELKKQPSNFLEALLLANENHVFSYEEVYGNIFTMLLAGEDTTSNSISWALFYLAQHPEVVAKVREEAYMVYLDDDAPTTFEKLSELKFTNAVVQEVLRLKPTTPQLYFEANEDVEIEGVFIPQKTKVILQNKVAQTKETYFTNANTFEPERWMDNGCPMHKAHSPEVIKVFGGGPRYCPGMHLAITEMVTLISTLCKHFNFKLKIKPEAVVEQFEFTMYPKNLLIEFINSKSKN
ncbi:cytochrome P450 [Aestuariivivens insulae]|uniref:cytochrome P450 n=1 Tax=Aestuariivivens insulae TaxID=1621988 RepID=UPI001F563BCD|nr:cytochrome P450 [Aestuariivivens insulae]